MVLRWKEVRNAAFQSSKSRNRLQFRLQTKREVPLRRSRRRLNLLGLVGRARGFRVSRDPQTRGTEGSRVRAARVTKKERNSRRCWDSCTASSPLPDVGSCTGQQWNSGGGLGKRSKRRQAVRVRIIEGSPVCPAPWGAAGGAEQFNSVISEEGDCRKLKDLCLLEGKLKSKASH